MNEIKLSLSFAGLFFYEDSTTLVTPMIMVTTMSNMDPSNKEQQESQHTKRKNSCTS